MTVPALAGLLAVAACAGPWGVAVGHHPEAAALRGWPSPEPLAPVAALGAEAVLLTAALAQTDVRGHDLGWKRPLDELNARAERANALGLSVFLLPLIELEEGAPTDWRGVLAPDDPAAWWTQYRSRIEALARRAEALGAEGLVVGSELTSLQGAEHAEEWRRVIAAARARFSGDLLYAANHDALDDVAPFGLVDVLGVSAYFPWSVHAAPTRGELEAAWSRAHARLGAVAARHDEPLVLLEVGLPSVDGATTRPWDYTSGAPLDLAEQALAYAVITDGLASSDVICGAFFWQWFGPGGRFDRSHSPRGKPAEVVLRRFFLHVR